jgi:hypothetical protein
MKLIMENLEFTTWDDSIFEYRGRDIVAVNITTSPDYSSSSSCSRSSNFMNGIMGS